SIITFVILSTHCSFFNAPPTSEISPLSLHDALPIFAVLASRAATELHRLARARATETKGTPEWGSWAALQNAARKLVLDAASARDRKSTRLNSSHVAISYAVFCLKKKKNS